MTLTRRSIFLAIPATITALFGARKARAYRWREKTVDLYSGFVVISGSNTKRQMYGYADTFEYIGDGPHAGGKSELGRGWLLRNTGEQS